jgi:hypothetical protein
MPDTLFHVCLQVLMSLSRQVPGLQRVTALVAAFNRPAYKIAQDKQLRPGWRSLRQFIKIDHPDAQAKVVIDNKLMDSVSATDKSAG